MLAQAPESPFSVQGLRAFASDLSGKQRLHLRANLTNRHLNKTLLLLGGVRNELCTFLGLLVNDGERT
jgi:hypothetical protein